MPPSSSAIDHDTPIVHLAPSMAAGFDTFPRQVCVSPMTPSLPAETTRSALSRSPSSRRVIFPSLHASSDPAPRSYDVATQHSSPPPSPEPRTRPDVGSPCSTPPQRRRDSLQSLRPFPSLTSSERERLLSRLLDSPSLTSPHHMRGRTSSDDSSCSLSTEDRSSGATTPCHPPHQFKVPSVVRAFPMTVTKLEGPSSSSNKRMPESSLFSLMLPSFDYLINPRRHDSDAPVLSVFTPSKGQSAPSACAKSVTQEVKKPLVPILRKRSSSQMTRARCGSDNSGPAKASNGRAIVSRSVSESSDLPSLTSSVSSDSLMMDDDDLDPTSCHGRRNPSASNAGRRSAAVSFCPKVWVRVFERSQRERDCIWYTPRDMEGFKAEAMERIQTYYRHQQQRQGEKSLLPTVTGRVVSTAAPAQRLLFSHQALQAECDLLAGSARAPLDACAPASDGDDKIPDRIERILVVDPHEVCLKLLSQAFRLLFPGAIVHEATSSADALGLMDPSGQQFDVIVVEERLNRAGKARDLLGSGSTLLAGIRDSTSSPPLFIGVTSHPEVDTQKLQQHGADVVWSKPPPSINIDLRNELLRALSLKRGGSA